MALKASLTGKVVKKSAGKKVSKNKEPHLEVELERQLKIQQALYEIADAASAVTDMQSFYRRLHKIVGKLIYAKSFYVTLYDSVTGTLSSPYFADETGDEPPPPIKIDPSNKSLRAYVLLKGKTLHVSAEEIEKGRRSGRFEPMGTPAEDWIGVPLKADGQVIGSLTVQSYKKGVRYEEHDVRLLEFVARHIAIALTRIRASEETQRLLRATEQRAAELAIINSVQAGLASQLDIQAIYELVGDKIREIFDANTVVLATFDFERGMMHRRYIIERGVRYFIEPAPIPNTWNQFIRQGRSTLINNNLMEYMRQLDPDFEVPVGEVPKCSLSVPLRIKGELSGVISLQNVDRENAFSESDMRLLETLANSMSVALENARLFDETQHLLKETEDRAAELAIINSLQAGLASKLDMQAIYELIGEKVRDVFSVEVMDIVNYDPAANLISMPYSYEKGDRSVITPREPYGFRLQVIESRAPLLINQNFVELALQYNNPLLTGAWPKSALFVPLLVDGKVKSIISIQDLARENAFSASDVQLLQTLANAMSMALENARLFDETQHLLKETEHRAQELATVNTVSAALAGELDLRALIELVGEQVRSVFKADIAFVALLDKENNVINFPYQYGEQPEPIQLGQGLTSKIIQSGQPLLINQDMERQRQQMGVELVGTGAQSFLGVPIFVGGESIGVISVQSTKQEGLFTENDQRLLSTIAANVGVALQNARLFAETQRLFQAERRAHEQAETLRSVAQALNRSLSLTEVFDLVLTEIQKVIPYDSAGIYQVHENRRVFITGRGFANLEDLIGVSFEFNQQDDEIGYLISQSLQPLFLEDASEQYPQYFSSGLHAATKIRSYMAVPIVLNEKLIGMITLDREEPGFYKDQHARLAMAFAAQAATAINNARLFDETQQRNAELAIINSVQEGLASKLDMQEIYELVGEKLREVFRNADLSIGVYDPETDMLSAPFVVEHGQRVPFPPVKVNGKGILGHLLRDPRSLLFNEAMEQAVSRYQSRDVTGGGIPKSALYVPLMMGGSMRGVVVLEDMQKEHAFKESDVRLLETLADSMSVALENARLWEQEKMYRKALQRELEIGREIQTGFLPEALPLVEGWEIAASLMSAREVAGDFYDAFELPDGNLGLVIADVCDKGVGAALFMTLFRSLIRVTATQETFEHTRNVSTPCCVDERLKHAVTLTNNYIAETHGESGMFATLFFGILDPRDGTLTYINGGHEPPLMIRAGKVSESLRKTGPAVGAILNGCFDALETHLNPGDMLFAFTDGAFEAKNPQDEFFGRKRLLDLFQGESGSSHELIRNIETALHQYIASATQFDDITLLAVRRD